jgi:hypothetical protein
LTIFRLSIRYVRISKLLGVRLEPFELAALTLIASEVLHGPASSHTSGDGVRVIEPLSLCLLDGLAVPTDALLGL